MEIGLRSPLQISRHFLSILLKSWIVNREDGTELLRKTVPIPEQPGIASFSFNKSDMAELEIGKDYHWYASVICSDIDRSENAIVDGWIKRIDDTILTQKLENSEVKNHPKLYADAGIWYETLETLAHLRRTQPNNVEVTSSWQDFLRSVGLENLTDAPLY